MIIRKSNEENKIKPLQNETEVKVLKVIGNMSKLAIKQFWEW